LNKKYARLFGWEYDFPIGKKEKTWNQKINNYQNYSKENKKETNNM